MKTAILTDTNSGLSVEEGEKLGIHVLPMPVIVDGVEHTEGVDIGQQEMFEAMAAGKAVYTSQPSPGEITAAWERLLGEGADEVLFLPMSSGLSGVCETSIVLAKKYGGKVQIVNNHRISATLLSSALDALYLTKCGMDAKQVKARLEKSAFDASIYICVDTLKYLKHGGRVTAAGASLATAMHLHPVLNIRGGKLDAQCVVRGEKHIQKTLIRLMEQDLAERFKYLPADQITLNTAGTLTDEAAATEWTARVQRAFPQFHVRYQQLSCSIGCHLGPNALGIGMSLIER